MNGNLRSRLGRLETVLAERVPVPSTVCLIHNLDDSARTGDTDYPSVEAAQAANPSPSGMYVVVRTVDCRRPREVAP